MSRGEGRSLSPTDVAAHLACHHRTQLERRRRAGELQVDFAPDARLQAMRIRGAEHERHYVETLRAAGRTITDLSGTKDPANTLAAMRAGADAIVQAPLGNGTFFGIADVLLRTATPTSFGDHGYEPVDTKLAAETKAGALLQLLTYCELLGAMQGTVPARFFVVTPFAEETYRTADYTAYFRVIRDHLRAAHADDPPPLTYPDQVPHCDICSYWQLCAQRRRDDDHPSLIADIRRAHVKELQHQGLPTLAAFARAGKLPAPPDRGRAPTYERLAHQARLQLEARTQATIPVEQLPIEPGRGLCRLPAPSRGDVFLDFEGDPFIGQGGLEYLTGYSFVDAAGTVAYQRLWALDHTAEKRALESLLDFLAARRQDHPELHVFHFGAYEVAALRRLCARHDTRGAVLDEFLRAERFVDLHTVVREALRIGIEGYGLKELEPVIGYPRQFDLRAAGEARRDLELHLELGRRNQITDELQQQVAAYNRDDCLATAHLRDWLEQQRAAVVTGGTELPRPVLGPPEASAVVRANEARIEALRAALTRDLPAPELRDANERAKALLGDLVGYFLRERKSAWWEHFRLRELADDDRIDEREMLAGISFTGVQPKQGKERTVRCAYVLPMQETAVDEGDDVYVVRDEDPDKAGVGTKLGTVVAIDFDTQSVVIRHSEKATSLRPSVVFRDQVVPNAKLESGLLAFAEQVRDHGFPSDGPCVAALDLLLRRPPRRVANSRGPLHAPGEPTVAAALRLCLELDGGVLPIQGPPGSGKSFTGGHTIAALVQAGKKVGITAVSHKVIDNLLTEVHKAAAASRATIRLLHKHDETPPQGIDYTDKNDTALAAIGRGTVVGATAWLWARDDAAATLDYLFVDEAGQMSLAQVLSFARAAKNLVLLGDPQQLEQPHKGTHPDGADVAALTHLIGPDRATLDDDQGLFLPETWRLHPSLCAFTSELYYDGRLTAVTGCDRQRIDGTGVVDGAGMFLVECAHDGNQASSAQEVAAVVALVRQILQPAATWTDRKGDVHRLTATDVLVIAPYNAQVAALRRALAELGVTRVGTVDKFQGQEAPIVLYSCTSSSPADAPRGLAFLYDPHRLNVATSRARCAFVMVACPALFTPEVRTPEQMRWANGMCRFREVARTLPSSD